MHIVDVFPQRYGSPGFRSGQGFPSSACQYPWQQVALPVETPLQSNSAQIAPSVVQAPLANPPVGPATPAGVQVL